MSFAAFIDELRYRYSPSTGNVPFRISLASLHALVCACDACMVAYPTPWAIRVTAPIEQDTPLECLIAELDLCNVLQAFYAVHVDERFDRPLAATFNFTELPITEPVTAFYTVTLPWLLRQLPGAQSLQAEVAVPAASLVALSDMYILFLRDAIPRVPTLPDCRGYPHALGSNVFVQRTGYARAVGAITGHHQRGVTAIAAATAEPQPRGVVEPAEPAEVPVYTGLTARELAGLIAYDSTTSEYSGLPEVLFDSVPVRNTCAPTADVPISREMIAALHEQLADAVREDTRYDALGRVVLPASRIFRFKLTPLATSIIVWALHALATGDTAGVEQSAPAPATASRPRRALMLLPHQEDSPDA